ncbi:MAG TPA: SO_0444 family Cu/Zn efflux transporter [Candidatus Krumholzibacterium sp.]|nr:SO_0444 family Cu/Zn efflux transporter [Candidatus Krumholzibacterium sp.]
MNKVIEILYGMAGTLNEMSPYLLFGFLVAGILSVLIRRETVERHLGGNGFPQTLKASLFGVPLPLCSCGVIPVAASLRKKGAGRGATTSFLISTPQTGVDSIFVTLSLLGPVFAVFRPLIAFVSGVIGGGLVSLLDGDDETGSRVEAGHCEDGCCALPEERKGKLREALEYGFRTLPRDINKALVFGIFLAGIIGVLVPDDFFTGILGGGIIAMLAMVLLGVPVYVCATASVPIAAALIAKGVSPGAALVFLMTGPATNAATIFTVARIMGRKTAAIYLSTVVLAAVGSGLLLDAIYDAGSFSSSWAMPSMLSSWFTWVCSAVLVVIIAASFIDRKKDDGIATDDRALTLDIEGMHCTHCRDSVMRVLREVKGVEKVEVDLSKGRAWVAGSGLDPEVLRAEIETLGYKVAGITGKDKTGD